MRTWVLPLTLCVMAASFGVEARELSKRERFVCSWGSGLAAGAQASKLSGVSLYGARKQLQARKFTQPWMRMSAMGITEQTYNSSSRLKPAGVKQTYYEQCIRHDFARR